VRCAAFVAVTATASGAQVPTVDSIKALLGTTTFAFQGTVVRRGAVADRVLTPSRRTVVVRATNVLQCPRDVGDFTGQTLTVRTPSDSIPAIGVGAWFFATAWVIGDRIAVDAPAMFTRLTPAQSQQLAVKFDSAVWRGYLSLLWERVSASNLVALGTIINVQSVHPRTTQREEHVTRWFSLSVRLDSILRGDKALRGQPTQVLVPERMAMSDTGAKVPLGARRLFVVENSARNPDVRDLDTRAPFFALDSLGVRPVRDSATVLGIPADAGSVNLPLTRCKAAPR